jgi:hypothetical protein
MISFPDFLMAVLGFAWILFSLLLANAIITQAMKNSGVTTWWNGPPD